MAIGSNHRLERARRSCSPKSMAIRHQLIHSVEPKRQIMHSIVNMKQVSRHRIT
jgi:hypothetical protein